MKQNELKTFGMTLDVVVSLPIEVNATNKEEAINKAINKLHRLHSSGDLNFYNNNNFYVYQDTDEETDVYEVEEKASGEHTCRYEEFSVTLKDEDIYACSHGGDVSVDVEKLSHKGYIRRQLNSIPKMDIVDALVNSGIEVADEDDKETLYMLIIMDAACNLRADLTGSLDGKPKC